MHMDYYLVADSDLACVGGIGFDPLPAPSLSASLLFGVRRHLCPSRVMPWDLVFQTPFAGVMLRYHVDIFPLPTRIISVIDLSLCRIMPSISPLWQPLLILAIRKGQCQPALLFHRYPTLSSNSLDVYGSLPYA